MLKLSVKTAYIENFQNKNSKLLKQMVRKKQIKKCHHNFYFYKVYNI